LRIADFESRLTLSKHQAQMAIGKASKSCGFVKQISILEDKVSSLTAKIVHLEECDSFLVGIIESACELLRCKFPCQSPRLLFFAVMLLSHDFYRCRYLLGLCWRNSSCF
jgi:hypothetical protein